MNRSWLKINNEAVWMVKFLSSNFARIFSAWNSRYVWWPKSIKIDSVELMLWKANRNIVWSIGYRKHWCAIKKGQLVCGCGQQRLGQSCDGNAVRLIWGWSQTNWKSSVTIERNGNGWRMLAIKSIAVLEQDGRLFGLRFFNKTLGFWGQGEVIHS
jgi:hypothetical protein